MSYIYYDPKLDRKLKREATKKALCKVKDAMISTTKGDFKKAKKDIKEAIREYSEPLFIRY